MRQSFAGRRKNMRPDIKDGFDKAVAADAARTTAQREVQERARTERENFKADWEHTREHVIFPAFEQIRDILMPKGWTCTVRTDQPDDAAVLEIHKGEMRAAGSANLLPRITFTPEMHGKRVVIWAATTHQSAGEGDVPLRDVTEDFVQAKVLQFFQRLSGGG